MGLRKAGDLWGGWQGPLEGWLLISDQSLRLSVPEGGSGCRPAGSSLRSWALRESAPPASTLASSAYQPTPPAFTGPGLPHQVPGR